MSDEKKVLNEQEAENVSGGGHIGKLICCTCGHEIQINSPMYTEYYNKNVCPWCKGRLKTW